jgi:hypothetical protein
VVADLVVGSFEVEGEVGGDPVAVGFGEADVDFGQGLPCPDLLVDRGV